MKKIRNGILATLALLASGCAAPFIHQDAILGMSTADMMDSRIDQDALLLTVTLPLWELFDPEKAKQEFAEMNEEASTRKPYLD